jgi:hypothetical protein
MSWFRAARGPVAAGFRLVLGKYADRTARYGGSGVTKGRVLWWAVAVLVVWLLYKTPHTVFGVLRALGHAGSVIAAGFGAFLRTLVSGH